jgi:hypothetical protein
MIPILGIMASSISGSKAITGAFESIATSTLGAGQTTVTFSSIPSTYTHLQIRASVAAAVNNGILTRFNGDTANNYARHRLAGNGTTVAAGSGSSVSSIYVYYGSGVPTAASTFGPMVLDILDYTNTNKYKTLRALCGYDANGTGGIDLDSGVWMNTAAVTSISFLMDGATTYNSGTTFALYGIKGA